MYFLFRQIFGGRERKKVACQGSVLPVGQNRGEICRTKAGQGQRKGQKACSGERPKREGSWCNQAPGSTLVRKEIHGVIRAFALARIVPGKLPGSSAHLVCWRVPHRPGAPVSESRLHKAAKPPPGRVGGCANEIVCGPASVGSFARGQVLKAPEEPGKAR